jgi:hypothetical protein
MQERPSVKKLLANEKKVNEGLAKTTQATIEFRRHTQLPRSRIISLRLTGNQSSQRRRSLGKARFKAPTRPATIQRL